MITASEFADAIGRKNIADACGVGLTAVSNGVVKGQFAASWFHICSDLAEIHGIDCPPSLFGQKTTPDAENEGNEVSNA